MISALLLLPLLGAPLRAGTAMKPVVCVQLADRTGAELASAIEQEGARMDQANYELAALLPGPPALACFRARVSSAALPRGAR